MRKWTLWSSISILLFICTPWRQQTWSILMMSLGMCGEEMGPEVATSHVSIRPLCHMSIPLSDWEFFKGVALTFTYLYKQLRPRAWHIQNITNAVWIKEKWSVRPEVLSPSTAFFGRLDFRPSPFYLFCFYKGLGPTCFLTGQVGPKACLSH